MTTSKDTQRTTSRSTTVDLRGGGSAEGPEQKRSQGASDLASAMAEQEKQAKAEARKLTRESGKSYEAEVEETNAAIEEAGADLEARDDEVYGRTPAEEGEPAEESEQPKS